MGAAVAAPFDISVDEFTAWLTRLDETEVVGVARMPRECPIARYLGRGETLRAKRFAVHPTVIGVGRGYNDGHWEYFPAPAWVERFVRTIDRQRPLTPITAADALAYLK